MKFCHSQVNGWNWRLSSSVKLVKLGRSKTASSLLHADYRPKTHAVILLDTGHTLRGVHAWEKKERKRNLKLESG
jgi:hypothetical protein